MVDLDAIPDRNLGQLISHTLHIYRKNFWQFFLVGLPSQLIGFVGLFVLPGYTTGLVGEYTPEFTSNVALDDFQAAMPMFALFGLLTALATVIVLAATIHLVGKQYLGQKIDVLASYRKAISKLLILIAASLLMMLGLMASGILIIVLIGIPLMIFLAISWAFIFPLIMIEGAGPKSALAGSYRLVKGSRWRVLGIGIVFILASLVLQLLIGIVNGIIGDTSQPLATIAFGVVQAVLAPVFLIGITVLYFDLRARKEGLTLGSLAMELSPNVAGTPSSDDLRDF